MKRSNGFDARRLRPRQQRSWGSRLGLTLGLLLVVLGIFLAGFGAVSLSGLDIVVSFALDREAAITVLILGLTLLLLGLYMRACIRRRLRQPSGLSMSPRLKKRR